MAIRTRDQLKAWFKTGAKPLQSQFWDWIDSYRHIADKITVGDLDPALANLISSLPTADAIAALMDQLAEVIGHGAVRVINSDDVLTNNDQTAIIKNGEDVTVTLDAAALTSKTFNIVKGSDNNFTATIVPATGLISGAANFVLNYPESITVCFDGTDWWIL